MDDSACRSPSNDFHRKAFALVQPDIFDCAESIFHRGGSMIKKWIVFLRKWSEAQNCNGAFFGFHSICVVPIFQAFLIPHLLADD